MKKIFYLLVLFIFASGSGLFVSAANVYAQNIQFSTSHYCYKHYNIHNISNINAQTNNY
ncbi:hypothetical protein DESAMIL20_1981 [Desulfurella amilsii]|uniref:Uncharacterized protein n=1 Tax=Desulfurella amilsii TaxID=1562698 RepID=A0A1X4XY28_9BACT|nr:hypothetical protein [Desulfurella amilsii]OSS42428.1 hypothetical protein DESAMIL20_1981 [Desulfurella amilsii]